MTRAIQQKEIIMQTFKIIIVATSMVALASCANMNPIFVETSAICRDGWYGYWQQPCEPAAAPYGLAEAERDIIDLQDRIGYLNDQLAVAKQLIADLGENQASLQSQLNASNGSLAKVEKDLLKALQPEISRGTVSVIQSDDLLTINLVSSLLFDSGQDQLMAGGIDALKRVGSVLKDFPEKQVHVAGYTDAVPIRGALQKKFPSNKELSDARANSAAQALQDGGLTSNLSVEGHGDSNPIASNNTATGRAKNRRVEVLVT
jgi:chemotaxis protein MotB